MFYSSILYIKIIYLPKTQQIYKCIARSPPGPTTAATTTATTTTITGSFNKFQIQKPQPKKKNSKSSTKPKPNRSINDQTQPIIGGEKLWRTTSKDRQLPLGKQSFKSASRGSNWRASIGELCFKSESPSSS